MLHKQTLLLLWQSEADAEELKRALASEAFGESLWKKGLVSEIVLTQIWSFIQYMMSGAKHVLDCYKIWYDLGTPLYALDVLIQTK